MFVLCIIQIFTSELTVLPTCTSPNKIVQAPAKHLQGVSLLSYHLICRRISGYTVAQAWLK